YFHEAELKKCLAEWEASGFRVIADDVSLRPEREKLMEEVARLFDGNLNILVCFSSCSPRPPFFMEEHSVHVNNVGTNIRKPTVEYTEEDFSFLMSTNLESAYHLCQLAHSLLKRSGNGSIVLLAKNFACEWAKDNIRPNSVFPRLY
ncbi:Tropinone reductase-like protein, partial [Nymphaea thermarum]